MNEATAAVTAPIKMGTLQLNVRANFMMLMAAVKYGCVV